MMPTDPDESPADVGSRPGRSTAREAPREPREPRPMIERIGLAAHRPRPGGPVRGVAAASWVGGELFLAAMAGIGCLMTVWVGAVTLVRG